VKAYTLGAHPVPALVEGLEEIGLRPGDSVVVHSSLRAIGRVDGGAAVVVASMLALLGDRGTLVAPTFNYRVTPGEIVDLRVQACATGAIPEAVRRHPEAHRSAHPTHSVAAVGRLAASLVEGHHDVPTMGRASPLGRLAALGGRVLLLGVGHIANTTLHVAEEVAGRLKSGACSDPVPFVDTAGVQREWIPDPSPSCSAGFGAAESGLRELGLIRDGRVGSALSQLMPAEEVIEAVAQRIRLDPEHLLCEWAGCGRCTYSRQAALHRT
jgi:aminoglycoside 3-N-acetyltransferase